MPTGLLERLIRLAHASVVLRGALLSAAILGYALVSLWPFDWRPPQLVENGARWTANGHLLLASPGLAVTPAAPIWLQTARSTNHLEVALKIRSSAPNQIGSARIFTISANSYDHNLYVAQRGQDLAVRVRRTCRRLPVSFLKCSSAVRVPNVFADDRWVDVAITITPDRWFVRLGETAVLDDALPPNPMMPWETSHLLALGNEVSGGKPWLGEIASAVVRTGGNEYDHLSAPRISVPATYWYLDREPKLVPFRYVGLRDALNNVILYLPFGMLLAALGLCRGRLADLRASLTIALISLMMETAQLFFLGRNPSVTDLILNIGGGALGFAAYRLVRRRRLRRRSLNHAT